RFRADPTAPVPDVPFQLLTAQPLSAAHWSRIAERASWQTLRMNLNTFGRHGVYEDAAQVRKLAARLADPKAIARARVLPYQLLAAHHAATDVPEPLKAALATAMDHACTNVPMLSGEVVVAVDVSGSMCSPVTGWQKGASSAVRCIDVAALIAACLKQVNPATRVIAFNDSAHEWKPECAEAPKGIWQRRKPTPKPLGVLQTASALAGLLGGGTAVSAPFALLDRQRQAPDLVVLVSDNMSWVDTGPLHAPTETWRLWQRLKQRNPYARLVCIDLQPNPTAQVPERADVLTIGGFTDEVYVRIADFVAGDDGIAARVRQIEAVPL
ncbi:MAG: TROVE domain-containing protein, partial [Xanthomonadales bacterium]|nr:TROVE domain-containing protein [Xanthomonadales bacterium]